MKIKNIKSNNLILIILSFLFSCNGKYNEYREIEEKVETIEIPRKQNFKMSSFIDKVEYILLPDELSIGFVDKVLDYENFLILCDYNYTYKIVIIDKAFKIVGIIDNYGEGPGEYNYISDVTINKHLGTIDVLTLNKVMRFNFNGDFLDEVRTSITFSKFQHKSKDNYIVYIPSNYNEVFLKKELSGHILFNWNLREDSMEPVLPQTNDKELPFTTERNNLREVTGDIYFSMNFSDTIYQLDTDVKIKKKYFLNFNKKQFPVELFHNRQALEVLNDKQVQQSYSYHQPNLLINDKYIITRYIENGFNTLIYNKDSKLVFSGSTFNNDIDQGLEYITPFLLHNNTIYSINQADALINHYLNNEEKFGNVDNNFTKIARGLDRNSSLVITKYHLK